METIFREFIQKTDRNKFTLFTKVTEQSFYKPENSQKKTDPRIVDRLNNNLSQLKIPIKINKDLSLISLGDEQSITPAAISYYRWQLWSFYVERSTFFTFILGVLNPVKEKHLILSERLNYTVSNLYKLQNRFNQSSVAKQLNVQIVAENGCFHISGKNCDIASFLFFIHKARPMSFDYSFDDLLSAHLTHNSLKIKSKQQLEIINILFDSPQSEKKYIQNLFSKILEIDILKHKSIGQKLLTKNNNQILFTFKTFILNYCTALNIECSSRVDTYIYELSLFYLLLTEGCPPSFITENYVSVHMQSDSQINTSDSMIQIDHPSLTPLHVDILENTLKCSNANQDTLINIKNTLEIILSLLEIYNVEVLKPKIYIEFSGGEFFFNLIKHDLETYLNSNTFEITFNKFNADLIITDNTSSILGMTISPSHVYLFENFSQEFNKKAFLPWVIINIESIPIQPCK